MFVNRYIRGTKVPCVAFYIICVLVIIVYGIILRTYKLKDKLETTIFNHPICQEINGWSISHLLFFGLLGVFFPNHHLQFLIVGASWEVIESALGQYPIKVSGSRLQLIGDQDETGTVTGDDSAFWYGKESDIVMDMVGYCIGSAWASRNWPM